MVERRRIRTFEWSTAVIAAISFGAGIAVFVRDGALIPEQPPSDYSDAQPLDTMLLQVYGSGPGHFELYEDDGSSLASEHGEYAVTPLTYTTGNGGHQLSIGPAHGTFQDQISRRVWELHIHAASPPAAVMLNGHDVGPVRWDAEHATGIVTLPALPVGERAEVIWQ